jgi:hypothetical protein
MKTYIYIHVAALNNWIEIINTIFSKIEKSGLYDTVDNIRICYLGDDSNLEILKTIISHYKKIIIRKTNTNLSIYERITLNALHEDSNKEDFHALYLHTKGITRINNSNVTDWINYLHYFAIEKFGHCIKSLENYDAVGCNLTHFPKLHFSGNIWWANSKYIKTLPFDIGNDYLDPEMWILQEKGRFLSLFTSNVEHYRYPYKKEHYENKPFMNIEIYKE